MSIKNEMNTRFKDLQEGLTKGLFKHRDVGEGSWSTYPK